MTPQPNPVPRGLVRGLARRLAGLLPGASTALRRDEIARTLEDVYRASVADRGRVFGALTACAEAANVLMAGASESLKSRPARATSMFAGHDPGRRPLMGYDDVRLIWRRARHRPFAVLTAIGMLSLGIGLSVSTFSVLDALVFRSVPFEHPETLAYVSMMGEHGGRIAVSKPVFDAWRRTPAAFAAVESVESADLVVETPAGPETRSVAWMTPGTFDMLGVRPIRGRGFVSGDGRSGSDDRALISEGLWRSRFSADPSAIGRRLRVGDRPVTILGVMPASVQFPLWNSAVWLPIDFDAPPASAAGRQPIPFVRLRPESTSEAATTIATDAAHLAGAGADLKATRRPVVTGSRSNTLDKDLSNAAPLLGGGALLVLLVLCANTSSLLLVRLMSRQREFSVCLALGASRARLIWQTVLEHTAIAALAVGGGLALAQGLVTMAGAFMPAAVLSRTLNPIDLDLRAIGVAIVGGVIVLAVGGLPPAWLATNVRAAAARLADRGGTDRRSVRVFTRVLLMSETALACTLLIGGAVLVGSFIRLATMPRGLDTDDVATAWITKSRTSAPNPAADSGLGRDLLRTLKTTVGVRQVAMSYGLPPQGGAIHFGPWIADGHPGPARLVVDSYNVGADFFQLYSLPIVRGHGFSDANAPHEVVVGERLAAAMWPGEDPVGHTFRSGADAPLLTVIGVTRDIVLPSLDANVDRPEFYEPFGPGDYASMRQFFINIKCAGPCPSLVQFRQAVARVSPTLQVVKLDLLDAAYDAEAARPRVIALVAGVFAGIAVLAACGGLFSVLSYAVGRRRREFGVRAALGADPGRLRRIVFRDGVIIAMTGGLVGAGGGWLLSKWIESMAFGVRVADPRVWAIVLAAIVPAVLASCWRPAVRAGKIDPAILLRED